MRLSLRTVTAVIATSTAVLASAPAAAVADQPTFPVMNTSEQPPDGVWFRYGPSADQTTRTTGLGVYKKEHMRVKCFVHAEEFGPYNNDVWYYGWDVERPTLPDGQSNEGWMNTHYVDDGMTADHPNPSVAACETASGNGGNVGATPTPSARPVYFSPYGEHDDAYFRVGDTAVQEIFNDQWQSKCKSPSLPHDVAASFNPNALAGWSVGRVGVIDFLKFASDDELRRIDYALLIDPGAYGEMDCDRQVHAGDALVRWLKTNPNAHLIVISAKGITQAQSSKGIQEVYFNAIRAASKHGTRLQPRVLTCNYTFPKDDRKAHEHAFNAGKYWIAHRIGSTCPRLRDNSGAYRATAAWHP